MYFDPRTLIPLRKRPGINHPKFGDLGRLDAVAINKEKPNLDDGFEDDENFMIHLTLTGHCYARCKGCVNSTVTLAYDKARSSIITSQESVPDRDTTIIRKLVSNNKHRIVTVCFYGGEPFLAADKMEAVMSILNESEIRNKVRYMVYTNGELLIDTRKRYPGVIGNMWLYSVSIDGKREQHDKVRVGTRLDRIIENLECLRGVYRGNVLQWSTLREEQSLLNCFEQFMGLYRQGLVSHFFWHWTETREPFKDFSSYVDKYNREFENLMDVYVKKIFKGELLPIIHVNELILYLLTGRERGHTACGVEVSQNYDIVNGQVHACADLPFSFVIGKLDREGNLNVKESDLLGLVEYKDLLGCHECGIHPYCGGRCPVQALAGLPERTIQYCQLMRLHVGIVKERMNDIVAGLKRNRITLQSIYNHSAFMAKYTDVVP